MSLTIQYIDTSNQNNATCDQIQEAGIVSAVQSLMHPLMLSRPEYSDFNLLVIDLRDDSIERVVCYQEGEAANDRTRIVEFGGAAAWKIYRAIATIWPEINYHTAGRPPLIL